MENVRAPAPRWERFLLRVAGAGLLAVTGAIHLDLYVTGYRSIPTIGWLFLLQVIAAFVLGAVVLITGSRLAAAAGAGFALSTLGGYLLSVWVGLFGFREVRTTAGIVAGVIEVAAFGALALLAAAPGRGSRPACPRCAAHWPTGCRRVFPAPDGRSVACQCWRWYCWGSRWPARAARPPRLPARARRARC
jgi:hypothetical protein